MAHPAQQEFCDRMKLRFPDFFIAKRVLDAGSLDINGSNRELFTDSVYTGVDVGPGKNVDIVSPIHELALPLESMDVICSTECFEHDRHYVESLQNIVALLRPGGLFFFTCASTGRGEHGTAANHPDSSPLTAKIDGWSDYYRNLTEADIRAAIDIDYVFSQYEFIYNDASGDLYFWGIKKEA